MTEQPFPPTYRDFQQQLADRLRRGLEVPVFHALPPEVQPAHPITASKQGYLVRLSNEQRDAEVWPVTIPSAEEQAAGRAANLAEAKARIAGITARLALAHPALHPVIELHSPDVDSWGTGCLGCDEGAYAQDTPEWPCRTIELILEGLEDA